MLIELPLPTGEGQVAYMDHTEIAAIAPNDDGTTRVTAKNTAPTQCNQFIVTTLSPRAVAEKVAAAEKE
jgi:hypothetical protein